MAVIERPEVRPEDFPLIDVERPEGPVAAALIAGGVGCAAVGALTVLAEASATAKDWLDWNADVGALSGTTTMAVLIWLVAWVGLHFASRTRPVELRTACIITLGLVAVGAVGTFPMFFQAFASE